MQTSVKRETKLWSHVCNKNVSNGYCMKSTTYNKATEYSIRHLILYLQILYYRYSGYRISFSTGKLTHPIIKNNVTHKLPTTRFWLLNIYEKNKSIDLSCIPYCSEICDTLVPPIYYLQLCPNAVKRYPNPNTYKEGAHRQVWKSWWAEVQHCSISIVCYLLEYLVLWWCIQVHLF